MSDLGFLGKLVLSVQVKDHRASAQWYQDVLGCSVVFENEDLGMTYMATPVENVWIDLSQVEQPLVTGPALVWGVQDTHAARAAIEAKGVRFDGPTRDFGGMVRLATFFDPDGNTLMFYQNLG